MLSTIAGSIMTVVGVTFAMTLMTLALLLLPERNWQTVPVTFNGPNESGKTTLVDALMTLLVASPRYNLASTGGHESDRTLIEYVRAVLGGDGAD